MTCIRCGKDVDSDRVIVLQDMGRPVTCMPCSSEKHKIAFMEYGHKTAGSVVVVGTDPEQIRRAERAYRRAR